MPKVSVVIPVYGVEKFIEKCARSLLGQTYENIEYIFVDDCSPDKSVEILENVIAQYNREPVSIIRHEKNKGLGASRLTALKAATGDYILNVDSDDFIELDAVSLLVEEAVKMQADVVRFNGYFEWDKTRSIYRGNWSPSPSEYTCMLLSAKTLPGVCFHLIRRSLYIDNNLYPREGINVAEDYVLTPRLCFHANKIAQVETPLYHYIQTNMQSYVTSFSENKITSLSLAVDILRDYFFDKPRFLAALSDGVWQKKVELMLKCRRKDYEIIDRLLSTWMPLSTTSMNIQQKIAAPLVARRCWTLLDVYSKLYNIVFITVQYIKGR